MGWWARQDSSLFHHPIIISAHLNQLQPQIVNLAQNPVERRLIGHHTVEDSLVVLVGEAQAAEPISPGIVESACNADAIGPPGWMIDDRE